MPSTAVTHQGCRSRVLTNFYRKLGRTLPYGKHPGQPIRITLRDVGKDRSTNMHQLPYGYLDYAAPLTPDKNDVQSTYRALLKRLCRPLPMADQGGIYTPDGGITSSAEHEFLALARFVDKFCKTNLAPLDHLPSTGEWIDSINHPEWRKQELRAIFEECGGYESGWQPTAKQRQKVQMFIKLEDYPEYKECRGINSRSDYFKVFSGPAFHAIEEAVYKLPYFAKHLTPEDKIEFISKLVGRAYATDFTAFESHMTPTVMAAIECRVYMYMLKKWPTLASTICTTLMGKNKCRTRTGVSADIWGRRMSGDMCTSLGNGLTNILLALYIVEKKTGDYHNLQGLVEGDDGLFTVSGATLSTDDYLSLGFSIKMEVFADAKEAGFCQMYFSDAHQYVKDPNAVLRNFGWSDSCVGAGELVRMELLRAKALSLAYNLPHCPVLRAVADRALFLSRSVKPRFVRDGYHVAPPDEAKIPDQDTHVSTRTLFAKLYGIEISAQLDMERRIRLGESLSSVFQTTWLRTPFWMFDSMRTLRCKLG